MNALTPPFFISSSRADRAGVIASVLCAIHCAITPFLLILAPAFGGIWSHPLSHWIAAVFVVPLAVWMVMRGFRTHRKYWILAAGIGGVSLILTGAALPHVTQAPSAHGESCVVDACCPSVITDAATGDSRLHIPPAAAVTMLGGFFLIATHTGNLCACRKCRICQSSPSS